MTEGCDLIPNLWQDSRFCYNPQGLDHPSWLVCSVKCIKDHNTLPDSYPMSAVLLLESKINVEVSECFTLQQ